MNKRRACSYSMPDLSPVRIRCSQRRRAEIREFCSRCSKTFCAGLESSRRYLSHPVLSFIGWLGRRCRRATSQRLIFSVL